MIFVLEKQLLNNPFAKWAELRTIEAKSDSEALDKAFKCIHKGNTYRLMKVMQYGYSTSYKEVKIVRI